MRCALKAARPGAPLLGLRLCCTRALPPTREAVQRLLTSSDFLLPDPSVQVTPIQPEGFAVVRDDLLHPLLGGNKARKLDGLWPRLAQAEDVVTCGGLQSAHTLAVAAACAERGKRCHLLVRGERSAVPTGTHLYARMLAHRVEYVPRGEYADRAAMFSRYLRRLRQERRQQRRWPADARVPPPPTASSASVGDGSGSGGSDDGAAATAGEDAGVALVPEGAAEPAALLGLVRLAAWLAGDPRSALQGRPCHLVVDSGTGATATGLALGAALLGLPWRVTGVMLAGEPAYYLEQQHALAAAFAEQYGAALLEARPAVESSSLPAAAARGGAGAAAPAAAPAAAAAGELAERLQRGVAERLRWAPRARPRKFGRVLPGDVEACRAVAQSHGVLLDPIWSLAAWEAACQLAQEQQQIQGPLVGGSGESSGGGGGAEQAAVGAAGQPLVVMLHTGGALGLCGLAQRYPDAF